MSTALLALGTRARGVAKLFPRLCLGRPGVGPPTDTRGALGVAAPLTDAPRFPERACPSCFAVMPMYLLALDPAVILLSAIAAFELELLPKSVRTGLESSS